jgi:hypothetical protein
MPSKSIPLLSENQKENMVLIDLEEEKEGEEINQEKTSKKSLCFSITMLILSIPALIGS